MDAYKKQIITSIIAPGRRYQKPFSMAKHVQRRGVKKAEICPVCIEVLSFGEDE
jgi:hypothetical protein